MSNGRLVPLPPTAMDEAQRSLYDSILGGRRVGAPGRASGLTHDDGSLVGPFDAFLRSPRIGTAMSNMGEAIRFDTTLPKNLLELGIIVVGRHWTAQFEWYAHSRMAVAAGVSEEAVAAIGRRETPTFDDPDEACVYRFATELVTGHRVTDATYAEAVERLGEAHVYELTASIGYYHAVSAVLNVFEVPLPAGVEPLQP